MKKASTFIKRISVATLSFYSSDEEKKELLEKVQTLIDFFNSNPEINQFLKNFWFEVSEKKKILDDILKKLKFDEIFFNTSHLLLDKNLIFYFLFFLESLKGEIYRFFNIQNVYVYASVSLDDEQKQKLEKYWNKKLDKNCVFYYFVDSNLRMGIKIQVDNYIEEYSIGSQLEKLKGDLMKFLD